MLAKLTSKNQLTLPKSAVEAAGNAEYFEIETRAGQLVLTPVRMQRADAVRAKLFELDLGDVDLAAAVAWARKASSIKRAGIAEPKAAYRTKPSRKRKTKKSDKP
ncbi:MAG: AbrB/MazE/SpoVT family DNA-binding domain-containing protein [Proteobacteria bacterium]|nr:AbrB/MazE/SpoVT family DNA-binding domain-containing protein [Pseudomonadota bacterium]